MTNERIEALQAVVDRVSSYQESAPERTVEHELRDAASESGVEVSDEVSALDVPGCPRIGATDTEVPRAVRGAGSDRAGDLERHRGA